MVVLSVAEKLDLRVVVIAGGSFEVLICSYIV
jgi:hypothetical protein